MHLVNKWKVNNKNENITSVKYSFSIKGNTNERIAAITDVDDDGHTLLKINYQVKKHTIAQLTSQWCAASVDRGFECLSAEDGILASFFFSLDAEARQNYSMLLLIWT